jgi:hypothetical protein
MLNTSQYQISQHQRLSELRIKLLHLHKLLLETERLTYEQVRGHVSGGELLQLVISPLLSLSAKNNLQSLEHKTFIKNLNFRHSVRK